jgi:hypothetical protein
MSGAKTRLEHQSLGCAGRVFGSSLGFEAADNYLDAAVVSGSMAGTT